MFTVIRGWLDLRTRGVECPGNEAFTRPILACDQHVRIGRSDTTYDFKSRLHRGRRSNQRFGVNCRCAQSLALAAQKIVLRFKTLILPCRGDEFELGSRNRQHSAVIPRFLDKITCASSCFSAYPVEHLCWRIIHPDLVSLRREQKA